MIELDPETLRIVVEEVDDCVARIESNLLVFESRRDDPQLIDALFRDAHSVRGTAGMVGWKQVAAIAQGMEELFDSAQRGSPAAQPVEPLLATTDALRRAIAAAQDEAGK
jgi:two-component system chemotaxis sensor kinase CheA